MKNENKLRLLKIVDLIPRMSLSVIAITITITLTSCVALPTVDDSGLMIEVSSSNEARGKEIIDTFAQNNRYTVQTGKDVDGDAGKAYKKAFGYSGNLHTLRAYEQIRTSENSLPYLIYMFRGNDGSLFFLLSLHSRGDRDDPVIQRLINEIRSSYGSHQVHEAMPTTVDWLLIGD